ncbi:PIN domain-containing protein [Haloechinothrix aidingensis]|nr:PIN domain-containing protein [Haloechinothrix aidingensis]
MYFLDTNTVIDAFNGRGGVAERLLATKPAEVAIPAIVLYELWVGVEKAPRPEPHRRRVTELVDLVTVVPFGAEAAGVAARVRAELEGLGNAIGPHDVLIAATAIAEGGVLVTRNTREFSRVPQLRLESWAE